MLNALIVAFSFFAAPSGGYTCTYGPPLDYCTGYETSSGDTVSEASLVYSQSTYTAKLTVNGVVYTGILNHQLTPFRATAQDGSQITATVSWIAKRTGRGRIFVTHYFVQSGTVGL